MAFWTQSTDTLTSASSMLGGTSSVPSSVMSNAMPVMAIFGAIQSGVGTYFQAKSTQTQYEFQSAVSAFNASMMEINKRSAENTAEQILQAGAQQESQVSLKAGKVISSQKTGQGARGVQIGIGNAAEEVASTNLMKEMDRYTINANAVREAWNTRLAGVLGQTQAVNFSNASMMQQATADSINPYAAAGTSLLGSATTVASSWYQMQRANRLEKLLGNAYGGGSF